MAMEEKENSYERLGTGGKFRKRQFRRTKTTPYDRPSTSIRNGWFSKVVDPAHKLITYTAHTLFSSLFHKRIPSSDSGTETEHEVRDSHEEESAFISNNSSGKQQGAVANGESDAQINCSDRGGLTELEKLLRQKTFTRSEIDHLTELMRSRTVDVPIREEEKHAEVVPSEPTLSSELKGEDLKTPMVENRIENCLSLTPYVTSSVPIEDVASPADLAKAYMGSRPSKVSLSMLGVQSPAVREGPSFLKSDDNLPLNSPVMSIVPRTVRHVGVHENGFAIPRTRGRSVIYSMARTPYARIHPTSTLKGVRRSVEGEPSSSSQSTLDCDMIYGSKQGAVKHSTEALDNDVGSVGPIHRNRHKANLYPKGSSLHLSGSSLSIARSRLGVDAAQQPSSSMRYPIMLKEAKHRHMELSEENDDSRPSRSGPLPSKSSEMALKILQQLDKLVSPKEKSSESRLPTANDKSPVMLSPSMIHGQALRSMETVDSPNMLDTVKYNRFDVAHGSSSDNAQKSTSRIDKVENGPLKLLAPGGLFAADADSTKQRNQAISTAKYVDSSVITSVSYPPQKKRAFHMSADQDCTGLDADAYLNGALSSVFPVENKMTRLTAKTVKDISGTESIAQENTGPLSVVMPSKSSTLGGVAHAGTDDSADGSRVGAKVDASTSMTSSIPDPTFKPSTADTQTSFGSHKLASTNGSIAISPVFNFGNKAAPSKEMTNSGSIFGLEKVVSSKQLGADVSFVNFGASSDSNLGSSISSATVAAATDSMPKVREPSNVDTDTGIDSVRSSELPVSSTATTSFFTSPSSVYTFGQSNGSLAPRPSLSSPFTSQNIFSSSSLAGSSSSVSATSTPAIIPSRNGSSSNPVVASSTTPLFKFGSSSVPSTGLPVSSSGSEPLETKNTQDAGNGDLSSTAFGGSSAAVGSTWSGFSGFSSSAMTTVNYHSQGSAIGSTNGSVLNAEASPASSGFATYTQIQSFPCGSSASSHSSSGFATSTQIQSFPFGSSASSPSFGLTGNSLFPSSPPSTNADFSFGSSSFPSSSFATNNFNSGTIFRLGTSASSSAVNSVSSNSGTNTALFGSSSWQPSKSSPFGSAAFNSSSSSSGFSFGISSSSSTSSPTMFSSSPQFSFTSAAATTSTQPAFQNPNSVFTFGSSPANNDQTAREDSMAEDTVQAAPPATPVFGQQPTPVQSNFVFGASTPSGASPFKFGGQQNTTPPNPSPFQASGSQEFSAGGESFSLGTGGGGGGGGDKSGRRIVKVKSRHRKR